MITNDLVKDHAKILCVRLDNIGDLLMTTPALSALKESFDCHLSILTSSAAADIACEIPEIDKVFVYNAPWVKHTNLTSLQDYQLAVNLLSEENFDMAFIFTVHSQNPLPAAMMLWHAGIPIRIAYCRENPYYLLTHWIPDEEPFTKELHQVQRDLNLVTYFGAHSKKNKLSLTVKEWCWGSIVKKLRMRGADPHAGWILIHPIVDDAKRQYNVDKWIEIGKRLCKKLNCQLFITGNNHQASKIAVIKEAIGKRAINLAGILSLAELALLVRKSRLVLAVNTGIVHIAAATSTPVVVLYATTNMQHIPWKVRNEVLYFDVPEVLRSQNQVLRFSQGKIATAQLKPATVDNVILAVDNMLQPLTE